MLNEDRLFRQEPGEAELISRALLRDEAAIRVLVRSNNRRLYRLARSIVRDDQEAEDVLQEAYLKAFSTLAQFRQESSFATWLSRIVINQALQRVRKLVDTPVEVMPPSAEIIPFPLSAASVIDPERAVAQGQICKLLETAIDRLPEDFRVVLIARTLEGLSVAETSELLGLKQETVKTRLYRARELLKAEISDNVGQLLGDVFPFAGRRCEGLTLRIVAELARER